MLHSSFLSGRFGFNTGIFAFFFWPQWAWAQAAEGAPALLGLVPFLFLFLVLYFLIIRPQVKKQREHQDFVSKLKRGDEVLTTSGILGRIEGLTDLYVTLEVSPDVRIKVLRQSVASSAKNLSQ